MFLPELVIFDPRHLNNLDINSEEFKDLIVRITQTINNICINTNKKVIGIYPLEEIATGILYYKNLANPSSPFMPNNPSNFRMVFRFTYATGAIPPGTLTIAHGLPITNTWEFVDVRGCATDNVGLNYYPMTNPLLSVVANGTNIVITNGTAISFTSGNVVLEYMKVM